MNCFREDHISAQELLLRFHKARLFIILPILVIGVLLPTVLRKKELSADTHGIISYTYTDQFNNDDSEILEHVVDSSGVSLTYRIGTKPNPDVGLVYLIGNEDDFVDLRGMKDLIIELPPNKKVNNFNVTLYFDIPDFTLMHVRHTHRYLVTEVTVEPGKRWYRIPLDQIHTPLWWYTVNRIPRSHVPEKVPFHRCTGISFSNHAMAPRGESLNISVASVSFARDPRSMVTIAVVLLLIYSSTYTFLYRKFIYRRGISYAPQDIRSYSDMDREELERYLGKQYQEPELTIEQITHDTSISAVKIRTILRESHKMTMKEYITSIRITEAKRLLHYTDRPVSEIATVVGYKHVSSLNHVFKKVVGVSPGEFRKNS